MTDELINQLCMQVARLENRLDALEASQGEEAQGDTIDDLFLRMETGGSGGGDGGGAFAVVDGKITNRHYMVARTVYTVSGNDPDATNGTWYLVVPHAAPSSATLTTSPSGITNDTQTVIPLFTISNGEISDDYRGMPIVMIRE